MQLNRPSSSQTRWLWKLLGILDTCGESVDSLMDRLILKHFIWIYRRRCIAHWCIFKSLRPVTSKMYWQIWAPIVPNMLSLQPWKLLGILDACGESVTSLMDSHIHKHFIWIYGQRCTAQLCVFNHLRTVPRNHTCTFGHPRYPICWAFSFENVWVFWTN